MARTRGEGLLLLLVVVGAQTMILELTVPRLLAPAFGNTLFCWTAIIAVVLVALAAGYQLGGVLSSRPAAARLALGLSAASGLIVVAVAAVGAHVVQALSGLGMMAGPLVGATALATLPALLGAAVVPLVVTTRAREAGRASGECYAWSTLGSVMGVLATGYVLLPRLGTAGALLVGAGLTFVAVAVCGRPALAALGLVVLALGGAVSRAAPVPLPELPDPHVLLDRSNGYHRIRVVEAGRGARGRLLYLDSTLEGGVRPESPLPVARYQRNFLDVARAVKPARRVLFLGGGAFSMPRALREELPEATIEAIEIDRDVVDAARRHLGLGDEVDVIVGDARRVLRASEGGYDLIVNDAFHGLRNTPFHLLTREFHGHLVAKLAPGGVYAVNVVRQHGANRLAESVTHTLMQDFPHVRYFVATEDAEAPRRNVWVLASQAPLPIGRAPTVDASRARVFTDDHAPVEYLVALDLAGSR